MNRRHLTAILWLRWRLVLNQLRRGSPVGAVLTIIVLGFTLMAAFMSLVIPLLLVGVLGRVDPDKLMLVWDGVVAGFLFFWVIGVVTELQRSETLSLDRLLHLPVSPRGAFLLNYASSLLTLSMVVFGPAMIGLGLALVIVHGPKMLVLLPLVATLLLMVTAVTYQFRGWLATLMVNKRRRGTIVALVTLGVILIAQLPQVFNIFYFGSGATSLHEQLVRENQELERKYRAGELTANEFSEAAGAAGERLVVQLREHKKAKHRKTMEVAIIANRVLPPGWLPLGVRAAAQDRLWPAALGSAGALAIGLVSLGRSYRTTLRLYTGGFQGRTGRRRKKPLSARRVAAAERRHRASIAFLERRLPWCPEQAGAIALASYRSLMRSPQAKMLLLTPVILLVVFGSMMLAGRTREMPEVMTPFLALGAVALTMFCLAQLMQNIFGFDRDGFRVLVLAGAPRRDILLGKNLSVAPFAVAIGGIALALLQLLLPLKVTHLLASVLQIGCVYLMCCMIGNAISILAPMAMSAGTLRPAQPKATTVIKQMVFFMFFPLAMVPTAVPLVLELVLEAGGWSGGLPVYLLLSLVELGLVLWLYKHVLAAEGRLLQSREQRILDEVTSKAE